MARAVPANRRHRMPSPSSKAVVWEQDEGGPEPASLDRKMEESIIFFGESAATTEHKTERAFYEHLKAMAIGIQENRRFLDHLQMEIDEVHRELRSR